MIEATSFSRTKSGKNAKKALLLCMVGFRGKVRGIVEVHKGVSVGICTLL